MIPPISSEYIDLLSQSYKRNVDLFKMNSSQVLDLIEKFILLNHIANANKFLVQVILVHFETAVDIDALLRMLMQICTSMNIQCYNALCVEILLPLSDKIHQTNLSADLSYTLFEFSIIILDMCVAEAPKCAYNILNKREFYPWQELAVRFDDIVRICSSYDNIDERFNLNSLNKLEDILDLMVKEAAIHPTILKAAHDEALSAVIRWCKSNNNNAEMTSWPPFIYRMGCRMLDLIDEKQLTDDTLLQLFEVLQKRIMIKEKHSIQHNRDTSIDHFFTVSTFDPNTLHYQSSSIICLVFGDTFKFVY